MPKRNVLLTALAIVGLLLGVGVGLRSKRYSLHRDSALVGLPRTVDVPRCGEVTFGPSETARRLARAYMRSAKLVYKPVKTYSKVRPERARRIAEAYDAMADSPSDPGVTAAYRAMIDETLAQYQFVKKAGLTIELIDANQADPYRDSPRLAILDIVQNKHLWLYPTAIGFGSEDDGSFNDGNPLLETTDELIGDVRLCANDVFRIVHDYFGHFKEGVGFRADGEENAWRCHAAMYSRLALGAITTELRGQNSWLNYGPCGDKNRTASAAETYYAMQKIGLLPTWAWDEGRED